MSSDAVNENVLSLALNGKRTRTLRTLYRKLARHLHFPEYFGNNLDALYDCLTSLDVVSQTRVELIIKHKDDFLSLEDPATRRAVVQLLQEAQLAENRYDGIQFDVRLLPDEPIGQP